MNLVYKLYRNFLFSKSVISAMESIPSATPSGSGFSAASRSRRAFRHLSKARRQNASTNWATEHAKMVFTPVSYFGASFARNAWGPGEKTVSNYFWRSRDWTSYQLCFPHSRPGIRRPCLYYVSCIHPHSKQAFVTQWPRSQQRHRSEQISI